MLCYVSYCNHFFSKRRNSSSSFFRICPLRVQGQTACFTTCCHRTPSLIWISLLVRLYIGIRRGIRPHQPKINTSDFFSIFRRAVIGEKVGPFHISSHLLYLHNEVQVRRSAEDAEGKARQCFGCRLQQVRHLWLIFRARLESWWSGFTQVYRRNF